jgi:hypothetical protein
MKKNRSEDKVTDPAQPIHGITFSDRNQNQLPVEPNLSPARIMDGAATTTTLLHQILAQQEETHQFRDWGINE